MDVSLQKQIFGENHPTGRLDSANMTMAGHGMGGNSAYCVAKSLGRHKVAGCAIFDGMMLTLMGN